MNRTDIIRKIKKLRVFAELDAGSNEAITATCLADQLEEKFRVDASETEPMQQYRVKYSSGLRDPILILAGFLGLSIYGNRRGQLFVECTPSDHTIFEDALEDMRLEYNHQYRKMMKTIRSSLLGYAQGMYAHEPTCPKCQAELHEVEGPRYACAKCSWISKKLRSPEVDYDAYLQGRGMSKKLLK